MKILYIAAVGTQAYRARHGDTRFELGGLRKAKMSLDALTRAGHDVTMLSSAITSDSRPSWRSEEREQWALPSGAAVEVRYPATLTVRPIGGLLNSVKAPWSARSLLRDFVPDRVVAYNSSVFETLASLTVKRATGAPIILQVEDLPLSRRREYGNVKPWLDQRCWGPMLRAASGFTAVNQSILAMLPSDRPRRLLPGVIDDRLLEEAAHRLEPFSSGALHTLGYFGHLSAQKGVSVLLDVAESLPAGWRLQVSGSGPLRPDFQALARRLPERVEFLGTVSDEMLFQALCSCDATVVPLEQITEGGKGVFPFKVLEYIAAGTHVISTPLPAVGELDLTFTQRWDGSAAGLLSALNHAELAYGHERPQREAAMESIRARYSVLGTSAVFSELLGAPGQP